MIKDITVEQLTELEKPILLDVRSEAEFLEATIPGALNLPLLNNEERALVGTVYTKVSPHEARELGLKLISPKLPQMASQAAELAGKGQLVVFCWRGGLRSKSFATIIDLLGYPVLRLQGGYKAYRKRVVSYFEAPFPFQVVVLRGNTGVGKTEIINKLRLQGYPAIDLEGLANNRGSVFGAMGLGEQPSQKMFESLLYEELHALGRVKYIIVECESKRIGKVTLPNELYLKMQKGSQILVYDHLEKRVDRLVQEYTTINNADEEIRQAISRLYKRLGAKIVQEYLDLLNSKQYSEFTRRILIDYYDKLYAYPNEASSDYCLSILNNPDGLEQLQSYLDSRFGEYSDETCV